MLKRILCLATACLLISSICTAPVVASTQAPNEQELAQKTKAKIAKLGSGPKARIEVKLQDGTRLKGYISESSEDHFVVTDKKTGSVTTVTYAQVKQIKTSIDNPLSDPRVWLGLALIPTLIVVGILAKRVD